MVAAEFPRDLEELYLQQYPALYRTIRAIVLDHETAHDLVHDVFERALRHQTSFRGQGNVRGWLHRIAVNLAISHWRRQRLTRLLPFKIYQPAERRPDEDAEAHMLVEEALSVLSPKLRAVVVLHFYHRFTREEIAAILGIPPGTVGSRLAKAMESMRQVLPAIDPADASRRHP